MKLNIDSLVTLMTIDKRKVLAMALLMTLQMLNRGLPHQPVKTEEASWMKVKHPQENSSPVATSSCF